MRILIVDDEPRSLMDLVRSVSALSSNAVIYDDIVTATTFQSALDVLIGDSPSTAQHLDLVITDMHLSDGVLVGELGGEYIVRCAQRKGIPCIAVSSHTSPPSALRIATMLAAESEHVVFINKATFAEEAGAAIRRLAQQRTTDQAKAKQKANA